MDTLTSTATKVVSNTKLAIATLAMLAAGGVAFAAAPAGMTTINKWGGCIDLDNQYNTSTPFFQDQLFTKSNTKYNSGEKTDYCYTFPSTGKTYLMEGACNASGSFVTWQKNCAELNLGKTGVNYQCVDGACVDKAATSTVSCTDSDGGKNYNVQGTVITNGGGPGGYTATDSCLSDGFAMTEQYCENNIGKTENFTCPNGCKDGTCIAAAVVSKLEVSLDASNPPTSIKAGDTTVILAAFKFTNISNSEDIELDKLTLTQLVADTALSSSNDYQEIWFEDTIGKEIAGTRMSPSSTKPVVNFAKGSFIVTKAEGNKSVYLKAKLSAIGPGNPGVSGHRVGYKIAAAADVVARGVQSGAGSEEYLSATPPTGNVHYVYKAYPVFVKKSVVSNKLTNGTRDLFTFQVSAVNGDIALNGFTFNIMPYTAKIVANSLYLYDVTNYSSEMQINTTGGNIVNDLWQTVGYNHDWDTNYNGSEITVSANQPRTFLLRGNVVSSTTGASISTAMAGDASGLSGLMLTAQNVGSQEENDFIWSDKNDLSHSVNTADWANGYLVSGLNPKFSTLETIAY